MKRLVRTPQDTESVIYLTGIAGSEQYRWRLRAKGLGVDAEVDLLNRHQIRIGAAFFPGRDEDLDSRNNGTYRFGDRNRFDVRYRTDQAEALSYEVRLRHETEKLGGTNLSPTVSINWRPRDNLSFATTLRYVNRRGWLLWRDGIDFATFEAEEWRPEVRLEYFASAKHQFKLLAQWVGIRATQLQNYQLQIDGAELTPVDEYCPQRRLCDFEFVITSALSLGDCATV